MIFDLEEELIAWVNRPKKDDSHTSTQFLPPSIIVPSAPASVTEAALQKLPPATTTSSSLSPFRDGRNGEPPIFISAPPVIRIPRVEGRGGELLENAPREAADFSRDFARNVSVISCITDRSTDGSFATHRRSTTESCTTHRSSPIGAIALLARGAIKACSRLAPPLGRRRSSNGVNGIVENQDQLIVEPKPKCIGEDDYTRIHQLISSSSYLVSSMPNGSECGFNHTDLGDANCVEVTTPHAASSNTARGRQRHRVGSPEMNNFQREEDKISASCSTNIDPGATQVSNLPWRDNPNNGELHGLYSGPVNDVLQPHGGGVLLLRENTFLKFYGHWINGELVLFPGFNQRLLNEDEKRDYDSNRRSAIIYSGKKASPSQTYERKSSTGHLSNHPDVSVSTGTLSSSEDLGRYTSANTLSRQHPPRQKYTLGQVARSPSHMVIHRSEEKATQSASMLRKYDQAFIKRSNGLW
jgi:hypothetical protein